VINKKNILRFSLASFCLASILGIVVALSLHSDDESGKRSARTTAVASIFGVLGISSFFVGLAYPKE
jgi:hypothetical protein